MIISTNKNPNNFKKITYNNNFKKIKESEYFKYFTIKKLKFNNYKKFSTEFKKINLEIISKLEFKNKGGILKIPLDVLNLIIKSNKIYIENKLEEIKKEVKKTYYSYF